MAATPATATPHQAPSPGPAPAALAAAAADSVVGSAGKAGLLRRAAGDDLKRTGVVQGTRGLQYVTYARTFKGLAVVGGDVVVTTDAAGTVKDTAVAETAAISVGTTPKITAARAAAIARARLAKVDSAGAPTLKVLAGETPKLAYEAVVEGRTAQNKPSNLHIFVDAATGAILDEVDYVREGTGNGYYYGNVTITTSGSGSSYSMTDTTRPGLRCGGQNGTAYTGTDDAWGTGSGTNLETACVDALWGAQREVDMLSSWFNRNGINGNGNNPPIRVGLADVNAYWNGSYVNFGHNQANNRQATPIDVVGHEMGHAIFQNTPGGAGSGNENGGLNEATGDIFGALTEAYANSPLDPPDYQVGEEVDLVGQGPIRYMYNPSIAGDPNCYSSSIPSTEVHAAAGPLNHWFYLTAEGSSPTNGQPASPTCNSTTVTGLGIRKAGEIYYNAMQSKTSTWRHANVRTATLAAAKNLYAPSCAEFNVVKAAWAAVSVPAQTGEATCTGTPANDFSVSASPTSGSVAAGSSATTTVATATTAGSAQTVALTASGLPSGATASFSPASVTSGSSSTLTIATTAATPSGSYPVTITGTGSATHTATYTLTVTGGPGGSCAGTNGTDVAIPDLTTVTSTITISGCARNASATSTVAVNILHTFRGDLVIDLVAPDGTAYRLKNSSATDSADNVVATYTTNLSSEAANGAWKLQVRDAVRNDIGTINTWTLTL
ncbi:peptidase M4 family protein [Actinoplanes sp. ATCC 53533]|uniref:M4 family metallopeptidase n=1 Tax=Actinoplanes sp. ATCC 53533 TaxID=1288362 RepID=UPI000F77D775|nr:M4 family metallopeptidase [Actinoplanes sp. ATCC 53533]RSM46222.1 peptidase M4 family protein [Actinoplanes sp. ATCC 53533]